MGAFTFSKLFTFKTITLVKHHILCGYVFSFSCNKLAVVSVYRMTKSDTDLLKTSRGYSTLCEDGERFWMNMSEKMEKPGT